MNSKTLKDFLKLNPKYKLFAFSLKDSLLACTIQLAYVHSEKAAYEVTFCSLQQNSMLCRGEIFMFENLPLHQLHENPENSRGGRGGQQVPFLTF